MARRRRTLATIARRLRSLFPRRERERVDRETAAYLRALDRAGFTVPFEGPIPFEVLQVRVTIGYDASDGSGSASQTIADADSAFVGDPDVDDREGPALARAYELVAEFAESGAARYILSASWGAITVALHPLVEAGPWEGDGDLNVGQPGTEDYVLTAAFRGGPLTRGAGIPTPKQRRWKVTRTSTAKGAKVRSRNTRRVEDYL